MLTGLRRSVSPWMHTLDHDPVGLKYRCQWSPPLAIDWFDNSVYFGCQVIFRTRDRGQTWQVISPDLSTQDLSRIQFSGGVVGDNLGQFYGAVLSAIAPSRTQRGVVWAGTNDGKVWISRDEGKTWNDVTKNVNMPPWGLVRRIDSSHFDPGTAYMAVDYHLVDNRDPFLFKTSDFGQTWTRIDGGLPKGHPLDYTLSIAENPNRRGMIFAGTGHGFFYSRDDGKTWTQFKDKLPAAPVNWIEVPKNAPEVVVATYGRGLWILRDAWQLEQQDTLDQGAELQLYKPRPATRAANGGAARFVFSLKSAPAGRITMEILAADGDVQQDACRTADGDLGPFVRDEQPVECGIGAVDSFARWCDNGRAMNAENRHSLALFVAQVAMLQQAIKRDATREQVLARIGILENDAQALADQLSKADPELGDAISRAWREPARVIAAGTEK